MADNALGAARIRQLADDAQVLARLRQEARERLRDENRDPDDEGALKLAVARARKEWIRDEMTQQGIERAAAWGWPNIYTYTKSMGDQLVARETGIFRSIVRPAIVESAVSYPFRGWNEGFTTSAPLVYLALKGQNVLPVSPKLILDVVPVDHVVAGMLMVGRAGQRRAAEARVPALERRPQPAAHGPRHDADRPLQAQALPGQGDRQPVRQRAGRAHGVPPRHRGRTTSGTRCPRFNRAPGAPRRWGSIRPRWGAGPLHRGRRPRQEGARRGRARHHRGGREHRAVPPVHLRERLRPPRRQHPRAASTACRPRTRSCCPGGRSSSTGTTTG